MESFTEAQLKSRLNNNQKIAVLSHWIRTRHEANPSEWVNLTDDLVEKIVKQLPPTPAEQADKFVLWLGNSKHPPGEFVWVQPATHQSIMGATTPEGFELVLNHLIETEIFKSPGTEAEHINGRAYVTLSLKGWDRFHQIKRGSIESCKVFMAMKYNDAQLDKIVDDVFKPAVKQTGFDLVRLDDRPKAGLIDDRLRVEIQTSRFLIADLTHDNLGAYWEAGYAEGLGKPVIYTCEKSKFEKDPPHFDTNHHLTIPWDEKNPQEAAKQLKDTIRATLPDAAKLSDD
ncbi:MAG: hypothetical protein JW749_05315 [Sedimentisphaerales bacterium]|nr:hypothetical protein [Sedimentisphaerales bacterium]